MSVRIGNTRLPPNKKIIEAEKILEEEYGVPRDISNYVFTCLYNSIIDSVDEDVCIDVGHFMLAFVYVDDEEDPPIINPAVTMNYRSGKVIQRRLKRMVYDRLKDKNGYEEDFENFIIKSKGKKVQSAAFGVKSNRSKKGK